MTVSFSDPTAQEISVELMFDAISPIITVRHSEAGFASQTLHRETVTQLLHAAQVAPSFFNKQPWHFIVIEDGWTRRAIDQEFLAWGTPWAVEAPLLIAVVANLDEGTVHGGLNYAYVDCGLAIQNILLQASSMGLAAHPVMFNDRDTVEQVLDLPPDSRLLLFIAIGHPSGDSVKTYAQRVRKPLSTIASHATFNGRPILNTET